MSAVALLALGNPWRSDDALGLQALAAAQRRAPHDIELRTQHLMGPEDVSIMEGAAVALFIDASLQLDGAFSLSRLTAAEQVSVMRHGPTPAQALAWAGLLLERVPPAFVLAIHGQVFEAAAGLSPQAALHLERALDFLDVLLAEPHEAHWMTCCGIRR